MSSAYGLVVYGAVKLVAYAAWCWYGLARADSPSAGRLSRAALMGLMRWLLGLGVGVLLFFVVPAERDTLIAQYVAVYVPVRMVEWGLISHLLLLRGATWPRGLRTRWIAAGILLSFVTDLTSPEMIEHGRFCVGRCLC